MHDAHLVAVLEDGHELLDHIGGASLRELPLPGHLIEEPSAVAELHDEVECVGVLEDGPERDDARVAREVLHDLHLAVRRVPGVLGQRLAGELVLAAPGGGPGGLGAADADGPELAVPDLLAEVVLALQPLPPPDPRGAVDAAHLPLQPAPREEGPRRRRRAARRGGRHHHGWVRRVGAARGLLRFGTAAGALPGGQILEGPRGGARRRRALALPGHRLHGARARALMEDRNLSLLAWVLAAPSPRRRWWEGEREGIGSGQRRGS